MDSVITKPFFSHFFRARVDVHRKDSVGSVEKAITIYGQPENCSNACLQILKVMQEEARNTDKTDDIPLKILGTYFCINSLFRNKRFVLDEMTYQNASKFVVLFLECENPRRYLFLVFLFRATLNFFLMNALIYVSIDQGIHLSSIK